MDLKQFLDLIKKITKDLAYIRIGAMHASY